MIISHTHKFIFIKSFKTAGTSVEAILSNYCSGNDVVTPLNDFKHNRDEKGQFIHRSMNADEYKAIGQHVDAGTIKARVPAEIWNSYVKISLSRNPWDRVISFFYWEHRQDPAIESKKRFYHYLGVPFDEMEQPRMLFRKFLDSDKWVDNDRFYVLDDKLCVDFMIRYEHLNDDFATICKRLGLPVPGSAAVEIRHPQGSPSLFRVLRRRIQGHRRANATSMTSNSWATPSRAHEMSAYGMNCSLCVDGTVLIR